MEAVGFAASIIGIIQLTGKLTSMGYGYIGTYKRAPEDLRNLVAELNSLQQVLVVLQSQGSQQSLAVQGLHGRGGALETCSQGLQNLVLELEKKGKKSRLMWPLKEKETMQHIEFIERQKTFFILAMGADNLSVSKGIDKNVRDTNLAVAVLQNSIQAEQIAKTREKILNWLYSQKIDEKHLEISGRRQKNTGEWLLKTPEFQGLIKGQLNSRLLWGYGIAGAGKSFLSSVIIDYLQAKAPTENYGIAYVYFDYKEQSRQTPINVLASLVKQLASQIPYIPAGIEALHGKIGYRTATEEELYTVLLATLKSFSQVFFVFDALDECDPKNQRVALLPLFQRMGKSGINLFLTSREHPDDIQHSLRDAGKIELAPRDEDITAYIESKIDENIGASRLVQKGQLKDRIISEVLDCSKGMFLLAQFHIEYICQQITINQILKALDKIKSSSTGESPLNPTYDRAMRSIRGQPKTYANIALKILSWLVKAKRTLTVDEIRVALSIEPTQSELDKKDLVDKEILLDACASLVTIDDNSNTIHLAHYTVQEYLTSNSIIPTDAESQIAIACATFLAFDTFGGVIIDKKPFKSLYESHHFLRYAAEELDLHLKSCDEDKSLTDAILTLVQKPENASLYLQILMNRLEGPGQYSDSFGNVPPLIAASAMGYCGAIRELFQKAGPLTRGPGGHTALHMAAGYGREAVVQFLLENGASPSVQDDFGETALHHAVYQKHEGVVRILLNSGADPSIKNNQGQTLLYGAASAVTGLEGMVRVLLEMGADHSVVEKSGETALHGACYSGSDETVQILLGVGADHSIRDTRGQTPLHRATRWGRENAVRILLDNGANPSIQDNAGQTALFVAVSTFAVKESIVQLLLEKGANHSISDNGGQTPLHKAVSEPLEGVVRLLLNAGADFSLENEAGKTALDVAMDLGKEAVVQLLLDKGAKFTATYEDWRETVRVTSLKIQEALETQGDMVIKKNDLPEIKLPRYSYYHQRLSSFVEYLHILFFPLFSVFPLSSISSLFSIFRLFSIGLVTAFFFTCFWFFL